MRGCACKLPQYKMAFESEHIRSSRNHLRLTYRPPCRSSTDGPAAGCYRQMRARCANTATTSSAAAAAAERLQSAAVRRGDIWHCKRLRVKGICGKRRRKSGKVMFQCWGDRVSVLVSSSATTLNTCSFDRPRMIASTASGVSSFLRLMWKRLLQLCELHRWIKSCRCLCSHLTHI